MNLEDYAYEDDGRWYIRPEVALNEQNAFINNYRNIEAQNNAQIAQQTRALGTQVPSQLGGLVGGGGYFRSRYQTPQTNQVVADLRSQMQGQALQTVLQNELEKAKKKYKDAQNSALKPSNTSNTNPWSVDDRGTDDSKKRDTEFVGTEEEDITTESSGNNVPGGVFGAWLGSALPFFINPGGSVLNLPLMITGGLKGYELGSNW